MGNLRFVWLTAIISVVLFAASCGGGATSTEDQFNQWVAQQQLEGQPPAVTDGLPGIPYDTGDPSHAASTIPDGQVVVLGKDFIQKQNAEVDGDTLVMAAPEHDMAYGMYVASGLGDNVPTLMNVHCLPNGIDRPYFLGLADYTNGRWMWFGPIFVPEYELDLSGLNHRFVTHLGNMYFILVSENGAGATHYQTTIFFGPGGGTDLPGAPHHLFASDGALQHAVGLTWQPGAGAAFYEIFRHAPNGGLDGQVEWSKIGEAEGTEYLDQNVEPNVVYGYKVRAVNGAGFSGFSNIDTGFAGAPPPPPNHYAIEGSIHYRGTPDAPGDPVPGVTVQLLGLPQIAMTVTDEMGNFRFGELPMGTFIVVPGSPELVFDPWYFRTELNADHPGAFANFLADTELSAWRVWGFVYNMSEDPATGLPGMHPMPGVHMLVVNPDTGTTWTVATNQDGYFVQVELPVGFYTITPSADGWDFNPPMHDAHITGQVVLPPLFFRGVPHNGGGGGDGFVIEGSVMLNGGDPMNGSPMANVPVRLLGLQDEVVLPTGPDGHFRFANLPAGDYIVYPHCPQHRFELIYKRLHVGPDTPVGQASFIGVPAGDAVHWLRGFVYSAGGEAPNHFLPLGGTLVTFRLDGSEHISATVEANPDGYYEIRELPLGVYIVRPGRDGYWFTPESRVGHLNGEGMVEPLNFFGQLVP